MAEVISSNAPPEKLTYSLANSLWTSGSEGCIATNKTFSTLYCNKAASSMLMAIGRDHQPADTANELIDLLAKNGVPDGRNVGAYEYCFKEVWIAVRAVSVSNFGYLFIIRDISERKALNEQFEKLMETNSELNEIIELSADGLVSVDRNGHILRLNQAYKRILGIKDEDFIGKPAKRVVEKGYIPELVSPLVLKHRKPKNIFVTIGNKEVLLTGRPVFNDKGELTRIVANIRDLTKLNSMKNELRKYHELTHRYETEIHHLRAREIESNIIGHSAGTTKLIALAGQAAKVDSNVLVFGETGTGKEVLVKSIHKLSEQKEGPFIAVNCSSVPESLIESELFGYEAGAFTGSSRKGKIGLFEAAHGGTLFLDEISEMSLAMQAKLLRVIQEKKIRRIGANKDRRIRVRIIAASNKRLQACIDEGSFRADLFYRLNIINIDIPPLRARKEDIPLLIRHFLDRCNKKFNRKKVISRKEMMRLLKYHWPGNIRELQNVIERYVVLDGALFLESGVFESHADVWGESELEVTCLKTYLKKKENDIIINTYNRLKSTRKAAKALNVSQSTIVRKLAAFKEMA